MSKLIYGVATNSRGKYKAKHDGKITKSYKTWHSMISRCYCPKYQAKYPTYIGCSVADEWLDYQDFADWFENHEYSNHGYHLGKDLLIANNKVYGPETCCLVPQQLNSLLNSNDNARGQYRRGVYFDKNANKLRAMVKVDGKLKCLGLFDTEQEAYSAYKKAKEANVKRMALEWQDRIADNVFDALMNWELD